MTERRMDDRRHWKAITLKKEDYLPDDTRECTYCLTYNQAQALRAVVDTMRWTTRWWSDDGVIPKDDVEAWTDDIIRRLMMSCCGDEQPVIYRYSPDGVYQQSTDGGTTWVDVPTYAYQNTSTQWQDPNTLGLATGKCQAADGVVQTFKQKIIDDLNESMGAAEIIAAVAAIILFFASAGSTALISAQVTAICAAIVAAGVTAVQAAFTDDVWNKFRCLVYNNMDSDTSISKDGVDALFASIDAKFTGIVVPIFKSLVAASGHVPMTNMMRSGAGSVDADCSACAPPECHSDNWNVYTGTEVSRTDTTLVVDSALNAGVHTINISTADPSKCCHVAVDTLLNLWDGYATINCGDPVDNDHIHFQPDMTDNCITWINMSGSPGNNPIRITFTFTTCP